MNLWDYVIAHPWQCVAAVALFVASTVSAYLLGRERGASMVLKVMREAMGGKL